VGAQGPSAQRHILEWKECLLEGPDQNQEFFDYEVDHNHMINIKHRCNQVKCGLSLRIRSTPQDSTKGKGAPAVKSSRKQSWPFKGGEDSAQQKTSWSMLAAWTEELGEVHRLLDITQEFRCPGNIQYCEAKTDLRRLGVEM
jgi:hypothetical protein